MASSKPVVLGKEHEVSDVLVDVDGETSPMVGPSTRAKSTMNAELLTADALSMENMGTREESWLLTMSAGFTGRKKIIQYDFRKLINVGGFGTMLSRGTVFNLDCDLARSTIKVILVSVVSFVSVYFVDDVETFEHTSLPSIGEALQGMGSLTPFLFGLFVSVSLNRWWSMRSSGIGAMSDQLSDISNFMLSTASRQLTDAEDWQVFKDVHAKCIRWGLSALFCVAAESRAEASGQSEASMDEIVNLGFITDFEASLLYSVSPRARAAALWAWISALSTEAMDMCKVDPPVMNILFVELNDALVGLNSIREHINTQLPFPYVHMITFCVYTYIYYFACVSGMRCCLAFRQMRYTEFAIEFALIFTVPIMYHGLLQICNYLSDPFGGDIIDFPMMAYQMRVCTATQTMKETTREIYDMRWQAKLSPLPNAHIHGKLEDPVKIEHGEIVESGTKPLPEAGPATASAELLRSAAVQGPAASPQVAEPATAAAGVAAAARAGGGSAAFQEVAPLKVQLPAGAAAAGSVEAAGRCPQCGTPYLVDSIFCNACGRKREEPVGMEEAELYRCWLKELQQSLEGIRAMPMLAGLVVEGGGSQLDQQQQQQQLERLQCQVQQLQQQQSPSRPLVSTV